MAVTLYEASLLAEARGEYLRAGVMQTFARTVPLLREMPVETISGAAFAWTREVSLGTNAFRAINGSYSESSGQTEQRSVPLKACGGDLDVDLFILRTMGMSIRPSKEEAKAADLAQRIAYSIIKGSTTTSGGATADANGFDGLQVRYGGGFSTTAVVDGGENAGQIFANSGGSDALSMRDLDLAIQACERPTHLLMPKAMKVNMTGYLRGSSSIHQEKNQFGVLETSYNGLPILEADTLGTVSGLEQLGFNENNDSTTSIYVLGLGDDGVHLVQNGDPDPRDLGEQNGKPVMRTRVEWYANFVDPHPRRVVRLYNIANLVAVA